jgi:serine protease Do
VGTDAQTEIALIKVEATGLPTLNLGDSDSLRVGQWVLAIGSPFGLDHTVTAGIVSARGRGNASIVEYGDFIQTDAAINPGNSGGPLLNLRGEVVGLNTAIVSRTGGNMGIGFAIPVKMVRYVVEQLQAKGEVTRGYLGIMIQDITPDLASYFGVDQGVLVSDITPDSPAAQAGLQRDDVIVELNGQPVREVGSFRSRIASTAPGTEINVTLLRNGERQQKAIKLGELDETMMAMAQPGTNGGSAFDKLGISVQNLTKDMAERLGYQSESGVLVAEVDPNSVAAMSNIQPGTLIKEVNKQPVNNVQEFQQAMKSADPSRPVLLRVQEGQYSRYIALRVG